MKKHGNHNPEFSKDREFTVVLEDLRSQFRTFWEELSGIKNGQNTIKERVGHLVEDVTMIKLTMATKKDLEQVRMEMATKKELEQVRAEMATKKELEQVRAEMATKKDLELFEKRLTAVEAHR